MGRKTLKQRQERTLAKLQEAQNELGLEVDNEEKELELEKIGIKVDKREAILVNDKYQTKRKKLHQ